MRTGRWLRVLREVAVFPGWSHISFPRRLWSLAIRPSLPGGAVFALDRLRGRKPPSWSWTAINPDFAERLDMPGRVARHALAPRAGGARGRGVWFQKTQSSGEFHGLLRPLTGLDFRDPLANLRLLEFCFSVPDEQYLRDGTTRFLARRVLADRLPDTVTANTLNGAQCAEYFHRMKPRRDAIVAGVEALERSPLACRMLDVPRMKAIAADWPDDDGTADLNRYLGVLHRGLHYGQFLRWIEGANT